MHDGTAPPARSPPTRPSSSRAPSRSPRRTCTTRRRTRHRPTYRRCRVPRRPGPTGRVARAGQSTGPISTSGEFTGNMRFAQQADRITGELTATGQNLSLASWSTPATVNPASRAAPAAPGYQTIWQEPQLTIRGTTNYDAAADRLSFDQFQIQSNTLQANAAGQIEQTLDRRRVQRQRHAELRPRPSHAAAAAVHRRRHPTHRPRAGTIRARRKTQRRQRPASSAHRHVDQRSVPIRNSAIRNPQSIGRAASAPSSNCPGPARTSTACPSAPAGSPPRSATARFASSRLSLAVGEGQLTAAPNVRFDPEPAELTLPAGPLITNVRISPEVSEAMLKYVAPVLAGATQSEGQFSLQLDGTARAARRYRSRPTRPAS